MMGGGRRAALAVALLLSALAMLTGCRGLPSEGRLHPTVFPPAIQHKGTLKAGIDMSTPPFGGSDQGRKAGIDLDVAEALATRLGLTLSVVDVKPSDAATALATGKVDVVMSVPYTADALTYSAIAGSYMIDGPAFFVAAEPSASVAPTLTLDTLDAEKVGVQQGSPAYWALTSEFSTQTVTVFPTLRQAFEALQQGQVQAVAGDAFVGAYIGRDMPSVRYAGQVEPATPLGVAVAPSNTTLEDAVRSALDGLAGDGVLDAVRTKWVGSLPGLQARATTDTSASAPPTVSP